MAPIAIEAISPEIKDAVPQKKDNLGIPDRTRARLEKAGIDLSAGYPYKPLKPLFLDDVYNIRSQDRAYTDAGTRADPKKNALLSAASEVIHLTTNIGTEIRGLQLKDLSNQQRDELALLIAERSVVFFRDQDISPQQQRELGEYYGEVEVHVSCCCETCKNEELTYAKPQVAQVPGVVGVTVIWPELQAQERAANFRQPGGASGWHTDLVVRMLIWLKP